MAITLESITSGRIIRPPRVILVGTEKIGKSVFAAQAPKPIFMPIKGEEGIDDLDVDQLPVVSTWAELSESIKLLVKEDHDYKTLVIDSISTLEPIVWKQVCDDAGTDSIEKVGGGYSKGYTEALGKWQKLMNALDRLRDKGMGIILIGHVVVGTFSDPNSESYSVYETDIHKKARAALYRWADAILFANHKITTVSKDVGFNKEEIRAVSTDTRYLYTKKRPAHPGGGRGAYGEVPYEMVLDYNKWQQAVAAIQNTKGEE